MQMINPTLKIQLDVPVLFRASIKKTRANLPLSLRKAPLWERADVFSIRDNYPRAGGSVLLSEDNYPENPFKWKKISKAANNTHHKNSRVRASVGRQTSSANTEINGESLEGTYPFTITG